MQNNQPPFFQPQPGTQDAGKNMNDWSSMTDVQRMFVEFMAQFDGPDGEWTKAAEDYRRRDQMINGGPGVPQQ